MEKWRVVDKDLLDLIAEFESYDEAAAFVEEQKKVDRAEGWYSSEYLIIQDL